MYNLKPSDFNRRNISFGLFRLYKSAVQQLNKLRRAGRPGDQTILFILGIQRAGTSLMYWVFERDFDVKIYRESSELTSGDVLEHVRLNPLPEVKARIGRASAPVVVLKPLVESQRVHELLATFPGSKALWQYRHYQDVASSNLKAFGMDNGLKDLQPFLENDPNNWRSQNSSTETRETLRRFVRDDMNPYDAAALFWWARCRLYFDLKLDRDPNVLLCRYEDLATNPAGVMRRVYNFIDRAYPGDHITRDVHPQSVGKGRVSKLSPEVDRLCADLLAQLDQQNEASLRAAGATPAAPTQTPAVQPAH
ncbi:sulfotransferase domain-containing protein [Promineifilum sp.]|uniref:sulfotransferase domain-containing protein n=1 Tax=Promineifilum sp. TaxID=2664178 RepID=UPI0035B48A46